MLRNIREIYRVEIKVNCRSSRASIRLLNFPLPFFFFFSQEILFYPKDLNVRIDPPCRYIHLEPLHTLSIERNSPTLPLRYSFSIIHAQRILYGFLEPLPASIFHVIDHESVSWIQRYRVTSCSSVFHVALYTNLLLRPMQSRAKWIGNDFFSPSNWTIFQIIGRNLWTSGRRFS